MYLWKKVISSSCLIALFLIVTTSTAFSVTNVGILAPRGELKSLKRWNEFGKYLSDQLGDEVKIIPYPPSKLIKAAATGQVDFMLSNPTQAVILKEMYGAKPLATLNKKSGSQFAGVIVARKGSGITTSKDLIGKKVMAMKFRSAAGAYTFQVYHLYKKGIDPHKEFVSFREGKKQDDLVLAVKAGLIHAAFVRTGVLENMQKEGKIKIDEFVVVDLVSDPTFPFLRTTDLYPEWFMSQLKATDDTSATRLKQAIMALQPDDAAAKAANIKGFVEPVSMEGMKAALKALKIKPFDQ